MLYHALKVRRINNRQYNITDANYYYMSSKAFPKTDSDFADS